ncbi:glycoside hydrolase family 47 protein, partial [Ascoidea rubescens DSM 1968]
MSTNSNYRSQFKLPRVDYDQTNYPNIQSKKFSINKNGLKDTEKLNKIKQIFLLSFDDYMSHGIDYDEILPISLEPFDSFIGWSVTLIDSLDTLYLMNLKTEFNFALKKISTIKFNYTFREYIPIFETIIRVLGGLISGYDLSDEEILLIKATELADNLIGIFDTPNNMPLLYYYWKGKDTKVPKYASKSASIAEFGSFSLEFTRLAQLTNNNTYFHFIHKITKNLETYQDNEKLKANSILNGLFPLYMDISAASENVRKYSIGGLSDSFYEYLIKQYHLLNGSMKEYLMLYEKSIEKVKRYMLFKAKLPSIKNYGSDDLNTDDVLFSGEINEIISSKDGSNSYFIMNKIEHLSCFAGGMFALSSRIRDNKEDLEIAKKITNGCYKIYELMGLMPENLNIDSCDDIDSIENGKRLKSRNYFKPTTPIQKIVGETGEYEYKWKIGDVFNQPLWVNKMDPSFILRPETIESIFYLYRITGDEEWRVKGWRLFKKTIRYCGIKDKKGKVIGISSLKDVTRINVDSLNVERNQDDVLESFWFAETLKYYYLLFEDFDTWSLDEYVFNTEAHPFSRKA